MKKYQETRTVNTKQAPNERIMSTTLDFACAEQLTPVAAQEPIGYSGPCNEVWEEGNQPRNNAQDHFEDLTERLAREVVIGAERVDMGYYAVYRGEIVEFITSYALGVKFSVETACLAVSMFDQYMFTTPSLPRHDEALMKMLMKNAGISALHLAAKYCEVYQHPVIYYWAYMNPTVANVIRGSVAATPEEYKAATEQMEREREMVLRIGDSILAVLEYNPYPAFPMPTLVTLCHMMDCEKLTFGVTHHELLNKATDVMCQQMVDAAHLGMSPAAFATSCMLAAGWTLFTAGRCTADVVEKALALLKAHLPLTVFEMALTAPFLTVNALFLAALCPPQPLRAASCDVDTEEEESERPLIVLPGSPTPLTCMPSPPPIFEPMDMFNPPSPTPDSEFDAQFTPGVFTRSGPRHSAPGAAMASHKPQQTLVRSNSTGGMPGPCTQSRARAQIKTRFASDSGIAAAPLSATFPPAASLKRKLDSYDGSLIEEERAYLAMRPSPLALPVNVFDAYDAFDLPLSTQPY